MSAQSTKLTAGQTAPSRAATLALVGNALCLDFTNTAGGRGTERYIEHLKDWRNLLAWAEHARVIDAEHRRAFEPRSRGAGEELLRSALELREALYSVFRAAIAAAETPALALGVLNRVLSEAMAAAEVHPRDHGFAWDWPMDDPRPLQILWPIARSAAELLTIPDLRRVKFCPAWDCGWLFLDRTRNFRRRWCEMEACGSRDKMRRYHQRQRAAATDLG